MQKFEHAENDLLKVLEYEPRNVESKGELQKLRSKMNKKEETVYYAIHYETSTN